MMPLCMPCYAISPLSVNSGVNPPKHSGFSPPAGTGKVHLYLFSMFSHMCAVSFVSCLPGSKSWEHNGPCLGLDNSAYEWEGERGGSNGEGQKEATGSSLHSGLSFFLMCHVS